MSNMILLAEEKKRLLDVVQGLSRIEYGPLRRLRRQLKLDAKELRKSYKNASGRSKPTASDRTFTEHYFLLQKLTRESEKGLQRKDLPQVNGFPDICCFAEAIVDTTNTELSTAFLMECLDLFQTVRFLTNSEHEFLKTAFYIALLHKIAAERNGEDREEILETYFSQIYALESVDFEAILNTKNHLEELLKQDPSGDYSKMDRKTKALYRFKVSKLAVLWKKNDDEVIKQLLSQAEDSVENENSKNQHIGFQLYKEYNDAFHPNLLKSFYMPALFVTPAVFSLLTAVLLQVYWIPLLVFIPFYEISKQLIDMISAFFIKSEPIPRMRVTEKLLSENETVLALSTMVTSKADINELTSRLEDLYYKTFSSQIGICVLADLKAAEYPELLEDAPLLQSLEEEIARLNRVYGTHFTVLVRRRKYSKTQEQYSGFDRKRGAVCDLVRFMNGEDVDFYLSAGNLEFLREAKYFLALDSDTVPLLETVQELIGTAAHPLNLPVVDETTGRVRSGYGIFVPRVSSDLSSVTKTPFAKIMGGQGGIQAYDPVSPDLYQDLFGESIFAGKGLINAALFYKLAASLFAEETVLSHDILEGALLRACYVSDVEFLDSFPATALSYFKRQHRWIRGDAQNTCFLFPTIPTADGGRKNPFGFLNRYKLLDNLRRAITPVFAFLCLVVSFFTQDLFLRHSLIWIASFSTVIPYMIGIVLSCLYSGAASFSSRYYSGGLPTSVELLLKALFSILFLPHNAYLNADAAIRAWYRRGISHKNMLEWTTAAQSEKAKSTVGGMIRTFFFSVIAGAFFLLSPYGSLRFFGILFLFSLFVAIVSSEPYPSETSKIPEEMREQLINEMARMFHFYQVYANENEHYLPPDNVQFAPVYRIAHRTSPTNIGFMMLSVLAARNCDIIDDKTMLKQLEQTLGTVEHLEKWHGNLFNWYDTRTLSVLSPRFVSTVDSGNFLCSLTALKEGLKRYAQNDIAFTKIIDRLIALIEAADLSPLYDEKKELFSIGYDADEEELNSSHYDMLMSEARMTSFFAIAKKQAPVSHWGSLSRRLGRLKSYKGPVSWTGTMFEYFMPELFLSCVEGSLGYEALRFCLHVQQDYAAKLKLPYGVSESGIYSFDTDLNYQYKANGVQKIALKSRMNDDVVVSPYSTYLTLPFRPRDAARNLSRLRKMGMFGRFGFYEAVDFTPKRIGKQPFELIKSFMAHHVGMSILALDNALNDGIIQKYFLSDRQMRSARELLQEKITNGTDLFNEPYTEKVSRINESKVTEEFIYTKIFPQRPRVKVLSNQELTALYTDGGLELMFYRGSEILRRTVNHLKKPNGFFALLKSPGSVFSLTEAPFYGTEIDREVRFRDDRVTFSSFTEGIRTELSCQLSRSAPCEIKTVLIENRGGRELSTELLLYLEPVLAAQNEDAAHPAFSKLFVDVTYHPETNIVIARRKNRMGEDTYYLAVGFAEDLSFSLESNRENILHSPEGIFSLSDAFQKDFSTKTNGVPDPCIAVRTDINLPPKGSRTLHFILSAGQTMQQAVDGLISSRMELSKSEQSVSVTPLLQHTVVGRLADIVLPQLFFEGRMSSKTLDAVAQNELPRETLWRYGISGDYPIMLVELSGEGDKDRVRNYIELHLVLKQVGILSDLVFVYSGDPDRAESVSQMYTDISLSEFENHFQVGRDHLYYLDLSSESPDLLRFFQAVASHIASLSLSAINIPPEEYTPAAIHPVTPCESLPEGSLKVVKGAFYGHSFFAEPDTKLPWSHILANDLFGTLLTNKSLGYTWAVNSRENKLTPWSNDTMADHTGEYLLLKVGETYFNLCYGAQVEFSPEGAVYRGKAGGIEYALQVVVDPVKSRKQLKLSLSNKGGEETEINAAYYVEPIFHADAKYKRFTTGEVKDGRCVLKNPFSEIPGSSLELFPDFEDCNFCFSSTDFFSGRWKGSKQTLPNGEPCAAVIFSQVLAPGADKTAVFTMEYKINGDILSAKRAEPLHRFRIDTPDQPLNALFNTWIPYQAETCRMTARTGFYQCGGAYGFRDQLQDASAVLLWNPEKTRKHLLRACAYQFEEGDVLHWWHELPESAGGVKGVRTTCSDDLVWLPYAVSEYLDKTEDWGVLKEKIPFAAGEALPEGEQERYIPVGVSDKKATVYEHCKRALEHAYRLGKHGLPLIGNGDWNDGLNRIGEKGIGESVWLAEFLAWTLRRFSKVCEKMRDGFYAEICRNRAEELCDAVNRHAWDGEWYLRALTDDGRILGSKESVENTIDSLPQSFSVFLGLEPEERRTLAMESAWGHLVDQEAGIIKLFEKPFAGKMKDIGYIQSYPVGVRENGGQYTHAAVWLAMAMLLSEEREKGYRMVQMLNPINHSLTEEQARQYLTEPYYLDGDVYANPGQYGRGGWSIYTGAAGWYYRCILETLLGFRFSGNSIRITPRTPKGWENWSVEMVYRNTALKIHFRRTGQNAVYVNGEKCDEIICDGGEKSVEVFCE